MNEPDQTPSGKSATDRDDLWRNVKAGDSWGRGLVMILFVIAVEMLRIVVYALALIQWVYRLVTRKPLGPAMRFGESLGLYADQIVRYLTYASDTKPFPFAEWPAAGVSADVAGAAEPSAPPPPPASPPPLGPLDTEPEPPRHERRDGPEGAPEGGPEGAPPKS